MNSEPTYNLLNSINYPEDLRKLTVEQLPEVCGELRQDIIKELCCNPGHFAALCDLPGSVFGSDGYHLSGDIG